MKALARLAINRPRHWCRNIARGVLQIGGPLCRRLTHLETFNLGIFATMIAFFLIVLLLKLFDTATTEDFQTLRSPWHYRCDAGYCVKTEITEKTENPVSLDVCQLFCGEGVLWPKPTGHMSINNFTTDLNPDVIVLNNDNLKGYVGQLLQKNIERLKANAKNLVGTKRIEGGEGLIINVSTTYDVNIAQLTLDTSEEYTLRIYKDGASGQLFSNIESKSYFGVRHALETLSQLIVFDDLYGKLKIANNVYINDKPAFPYRGILLDTSRNFVDKSTILRTIEAMAMSKMNTFHWHLTDSHSFPYVSRSWPKMSKYGAYNPDKVYTEDDVKEIVQFALVRGIRVLPEFDAPAHVGEGWQWVGHNSTVCFKAEPWRNYCVEPPCGQLNPTSDKVYEILLGIYKDMLQDFKPDFFHMGGDEVNINCWNSSETIKKWMLKKGWDLSEPNFYKLWNHFQTRAYNELTKANNGSELKAVLWTSGLTNEENLQYLDFNKYIIQIWTTAYDSTIARLLKNNFSVILSNYDALYLDCGFGAWVGEGNNWCSPYKGWQKIYENSPMKILKRHNISSDHKNLVLGAEAALWSEQVDSTSIDSRLWPRSAAMAERLWSDPTSSWIHAEHRILRHRERLVQQKILADSLEPEWCLQNQGSCY